MRSAASFYLTSKPFLADDAWMFAPFLNLAVMFLVSSSPCENIVENSFEWIVKLKSEGDFLQEGASLAEAQARRARAHARLNQDPFRMTNALEPIQQVIVRLPVTENEGARLLELTQSNDYVFLRKNCRMRPSLVPDDPGYGNQWYLGTIDAPEAWDLTTGSTAVQVAILDTGVDTSHVDLAANTVAGYNVGTCGLYDSPGCGTVTPVVTGDACRQHGTRVAGIAGAIGNNATGIAGVGFNIQIMPVRVTNAVNCTASIADLAEGILWASLNGAKVINVSYGGAYHPTIQDASAVARRNGSLVIYSAGNDGADLNTVCTAELGSSVCATVIQPDVLIVGATTSTDALASFSNYGAMVDLVAPGVDIYSTTIGDTYAGNDSGVTTDDGTSFSAPMVAGAAALLFSLRPGLTPAEVEQALLESATDLGTAGEDTTFGAGRLDLDDALQMILEESQSSLIDVDDRRLDFLIPRGPSFVGSADLQTVDGPTSRVIALTGQNPGLFSIQLEDLGNNQLTMSELPEHVNVGTRSLFYMKDDTSTEFVFTNQNRTYVYFASTTAFGALRADQPVVSTKACGPFQEISDLHLTENGSGVTSRLVVADRGANTVFSYALTPTASTLCSDVQSASISNPQWLKSISGATPTLLIGSQSSSGLIARAYTSTTMAAAGAAVTITSSRSATFGKPFQDPTNGHLLLPIQNANDATGTDYVRIYNTSLALQSTFTTCRVPTEIRQDFAGADRFRYVHCPSVKQIRVYNTSNALMRTVHLNAIAKKIIVLSDTSFRYIGVLRFDNTFTIYRASYSATAAAFSATNISLPAPMIDMGMFPGSYYVTLVGSTTQLTGGPSLVTFVDLLNRTVLDTISLPTSITDIVAQSDRVAHFISDAADSAYTLQEISNGVWRLRHFPVGDEPIQIGYRDARLYTLNRRGSSVSLIDLTTDSVATIATETRPVAFDFNTTLERLWAINETSQSVTTLNLSRTGESLVSHTSLGFTPRKITYDPGTGYVYVAGGTTARALHPTTLATIDTETLPGRATEMVAVSGGVWISSLSAMTASLMNGSTLTTTTFASSPQVLASTGSLGAAGLLGADQFATSSGLTKTAPPFTSLFANSSGFFTFEKTSGVFRHFPAGLLSATQNASYELRVPLEPTKVSTDSDGNLWLADRSRLKIQRVSSELQLEALSDLTRNHLIDLVSWNAENRVYALARDLNALFILNTTTNDVKVRGVCQSPRQIILDSNSSQLIIRCPPSNSLSIVSLDDYGDFSSHRLVATRQRPVDMAFNTSTDRLYVVNRDSDLVQVFDTTNWSTAATNITTESKPSAIVVNETTDYAYVFHESSENRLNITNLLSTTSTDIDTIGVTKARLNSSNGNIYALSPTRRSIHTSGATFTAGGTTLTSDLSTMNTLEVSAAANKAYITIPSEDVLRIYVEGGVITDVATGSRPVYPFVFPTTSRVYVSNYDDDSLTVVSTTSNAIVGTVSLPSGCGPTKSTSASIASVNYILILCEKSDSIVRVHAADLTVGANVSLSASNLP